MYKPQSELGGHGYPKEEAMAVKMIHTTGIGPFSGMQVAKPKAKMPKLSIPTKVLEATVRKALGGRKKR